MNKILKSAAILISALTVQSFAIAGVGIHYNTNTGTLNSATDNLGPEGAEDLIQFNREELSGLQGLGFKVWLDVIPVIDIEGTFNIQFGRYNSNIVFDEPVNETVPLELALDVPIYGGVKAQPIYANLAGDLSINYPFLDMPVIKVYAGAGVSYIASTPVLDRDFAETVVTNVMGDAADLDGVNYEQIAEDLITAVEEEGFNSGIGGHILLGTRAKLPVIPIAAYANVKYYLGGGVSDAFDQGVTIEIGGGFAL
jgi:hypothetical protein